MTLRSVIEYGIALGLIVGVAAIVPPGGMNDFTAILWPAARAVEPYDTGIYGGMGIFAYPIWNVYALRLLSLFSPRVGLICIYVLSTVSVLALAPYWGTSAWLVLLSPVFLRGLLYAQPFEALVFVGLTLVATKREGQPHSELLTGLGLTLLMFKPQIGLLPALLVIFRRPWATLMPAAMALVVTGIDFIINKRLWLIPWWRVLRSMPVVPWNEALWAGLGVFSLLWIPVGLWLFFIVRGDPAANYLRGDTRRELWVVTALGMLLMPYWTSVSLWPLVAMVGGLIPQKGGDVDELGAV